MLTLSLLAVVACDGGPSAPQVASVSVNGPAAPIPVGATAQFTASARDAAGAQIPGVLFAWSSSTPAVAEVDPSTGVVTARSTGAVTIRATAEGVVGTRQVEVAPPPVAAIDVTPLSLSLVRGTEADLRVTLRDAAGGELFGRGIIFSSNSPSIATVTSDGRVRAEGVGTTAILVISETRQATVPVTVLPGQEPQITGVDTPLLQEGTTIRITGSRFAPTPGANTVRFAGDVGTVLSADPGFIEVRLPSFVCAPEGAIEITVEVGGETSAPFAAAFRPSSVLTLGVGEFGYIPGGSPRCIRLAAGPGSARYLVGVQSVSSIATQSDMVQVTGRPGGSLVTSQGGGSGAFADGQMGLGSAPAQAPARAPIGAPLRQSFSASIQPTFAPETEARAIRWAAHQEAHYALREIESNWTPANRSGVMALLQRAQGPATGPATGTAAAAAAAAGPSGVPAAVPASAQVGDIVSLNVPDVRVNFCQTGIPISGRVRAVGRSSIWVEDTRNPPGGFTDENFQTLATRFDDRIFAVNTDYFGAPTDLDGNGRIVIVISQEVNRITSALGFVVTTDFFPKIGSPSSSCPASNEGEYYYAKAPDPNASIPAPAGQTARAYTVADALSDAPILLAHETTHIIQLGRRITSPTALELQTIWELEGQATFSEEVVGFADLGLATGGNYGFNIAWNTSGAADVTWFRAWVTDLAFYFGFRDQDGRNPLAPGACGWLGRDDPPGTLAGSCAPAGQTGFGRLVYGVPFSFLRWISDHYGSRFPDGERELHRRLVDAPVAGFPALSAVLGEPIEPLLARWAAALYTDDRLPIGSDPTLSFRSWNLRNIFEQGGLFPTVRLIPRTQGFSFFQFTQPLRTASSAYTLLESGGVEAHPPFVIRADRQGGGPLPSHLQLWIVRMQ